MPIITCKPFTKTNKTLIYSGPNIFQTIGIAIERNTTKIEISWGAAEQMERKSEKSNS